MSMIKVEDVRLDKLEKGDLLKELPEFYSLRDCIENFPPWHFNESVYSHTISVLNALEDIMKRESLQDYLSQKPYSQKTRKNLLYLMTVLHDIGKPETLIKEGGKSYCPGHEEYGARKSKEILERFGLNEIEKEQIVKMIGLHGEFCFTSHKDNIEEYWKLKEEHPEIFLDMVLFELADTQGLDVAKEGKELKNRMIDFYEEWIASYFSHP